MEAMFRSVSLVSGDVFARFIIAVGQFLHLGVALDLATLSSLSFRAPCAPRCISTDPLAAKCYFQPNSIMPLPDTSPRTIRSTLPQAYLLEWSSLAFGDYEMSTSTVSVWCDGNDGTANGTFRLMLNTSDAELAVVKV